MTEDTAPVRHVRDCDECGTPLTGKRERWCTSRHGRNAYRRARLARKGGSPVAHVVGRAQVIDRWGDECWLCRQSLGQHWTLDHVVARSNGGPHTLANLRPAHRSCNAIKGAR